MSDVRTRRVLRDLSLLPTSASGPANLLWWSNVGFMIIEGTGFALAIGAYLYLQSQSPAWPPTGDRPPDVLWGLVFTLGLLASEVPNRWLSRKAKAKDAARVRVGTVLLTLMGVLLIIGRFYEFAHLNVHWSTDAYGSVMWLLIVLHTTHLMTELGEDAVITLWLHTHEIGDDQFADVEDATNYWTFVVVAWLPIYAIVYWVPRWS